MTCTVLGVDRNLRLKYPWIGQMGKRNVLVGFGAMGVLLHEMFFIVFGYSSVLGDGFTLIIAGRSGWWL